jgi:ATP/maltotriose-dependent transcriptional regulator MalT
VRTNSLLITKLYIPALDENLVKRPRLIRRLDYVSGHRLTLVAAPPGFGKTTLLCEWIQSTASNPHPPRFAWLSLDEDDNDPARFWRYFTAALRDLGAGTGTGVMSLPRPRRTRRVEALLTPLINDLSSLRAHSVLVLDDYHLVETPEIHSGITFLLDHLPPTFHLVILSRMDPPLPLARLRARGQLVELRAPDLRFSPEETAAFLNEQMGLNLTPKQIAALDARAEGWIAGLQLAALSMRGRQDVDGFVNAFAGSNRFVLDYLAEEVLQRQTSEIQTFLLQTSILDQMNGSLGDAVTGRTDSAQVLAELEKANLFVVPLDDSRQWYRYHHLFADLLKSRLQQLESEQVPELHRRASFWYEESGYGDEAVEHALAVPDFERAVHLIEATALPLILRSEVTALLNWISQIPEDRIQQHPYLSLIYATALITLGKLELGSARLARVDDAQLNPQGREIARLLRAALSLLSADSAQAIESARTALEASESSLGNPAGPTGEFTLIATLYLVVVLVELQMGAGKLNDAVATCRHSLELGSAMPLDSPWAVILGFIHYELAELLYEWNDIAAAGHHAVRGLEICRAGRNEELESYALAALAQVRQAQGDAAGAFDLIQQAARLVRKRNIGSEMRYVAARQIKVLLAQGRLDDAAQVIGELPPEDEITWFLERGLASVARARWLIARHETAPASELLEQLEGQAQAGSQSGTLIEIQALLALARREQGDTAQAAATLAHALTLAAPEGYVRTFVDLGEPMRSMLQVCKLQVTGSQSLHEYSTRLLAAFVPLEKPTWPQPSSVQPWSPNAGPGANLQPLPESLSEREITVLRLIAQGLSNQEIADRLVVAVSTIKTHINNIYGKLGVGSRTQAVARARELKLLEF